MKTFIEMKASAKALQQRGIPARRGQLAFLWDCSSREGRGDYGLAVPQRKKTSSKSGSLSLGRLVA